MALYNLPVFNTSVKIWTPGTFPFSGPFAVKFNMQLYVNSRDLAADDAVPADRIQYVQFRMAPSDFNTIFPPMIDAIFGIIDPETNVWYYHVFWWEWVHLGFPNVYVTAVAYQCNDHGVGPDPNR